MRQECKCGQEAKPQAGGLGAENVMEYEGFRLESYFRIGSVATDTTTLMKLNYDFGEQQNKIQ